MSISNWERDAEVRITISFHDGSTIEVAAPILSSEPMLLHGSPHERALAAFDNLTHQIRTVLGAENETQRMRFMFGLPIKETP